MQLMLDNMTAHICGAFETTINGDGVRYAFFFQGCPHRCEGCHNPHTWEYDNDNKFEMKLNDIFTIIEKLDKRYSGITLTGGEPFHQEESAYLMAKKAHECGFNVWTYTGYLYEQLRDNVAPPHYLLNETDVLIDGPYVAKLRNPYYQHKPNPLKEFQWIGSLNQRVIDLKAARKTGGIMVNGERIDVPFGKEFE